jgi:Lrp/AsnC family transcriptional regulator, leucine-responsive regulatory protein
MIDKKDKRILFELDRNCRQTINEIAKKTRLSRDVVRYRIKRLENEGFIHGYIALIDFTKLGYQIVRLYLKLQNTTKEIEEELLSYFTKNKNVIIAYRTDGKYEIAMGILVKDLIEYQKIYDDFLITYRKYISDKNFCIFNDFKQYIRNYLVPEKFHDYTELSTGSWKPYKYDQTDLKILQKISTNAKMPLLQIAREIKLPVTTLKYRLKNLEQSGVIVAYRTIIDYHKLGYEYYKVDMILEDITIIPALSEFIRKHPNVLYRDVAAGGSDFEFDCELKNQDAYYKLFNELRDLFPGKIRSVFYYKAIKLYKYSYYPKALIMPEG